MVSHTAFLLQKHSNYMLYSQQFSISCARHMIIPKIHTYLVISTTHTLRFCSRDALFVPQRPCSRYIQRYLQRYTHVWLFRPNTPCISAAKTKPFVRAVTLICNLVNKIYYQFFYYLTILKYSTKYIKQQRQKYKNHYVIIIYSHKHR